MKKNIFFLLVMFFCVTAMASDIYCYRDGYRIMSFTQPGEKDYSVGLVDKESSDHEDGSYVWDKMYGKNISSCSIFEVGFKMGAVTPVAKISKKDATEVENIAFLQQAFACFCKIDSNLLNGCGISYPTYSNGIISYFDREICINGYVSKDNSSPVLPFP